MDKTLIVFDMDTNALKEHYHNTSWRNAYYDVRKVLERHGFHNIQGTVYLSDVGIRQAHGTIALQEVAARFTWFHACTSNIQFYDLKDNFDAQFIVDNVQAMWLAFEASLLQLQRELESEGMPADTIKRILNKRQFSVQFLQGKLPPADAADTDEPS